MGQQRSEDAELVAKALAGDRDAFGRLYDRHARMVRAVVLAVSGDWAAVEDLVQESFLRAYRKLTTLNDPAGFSRWIAGIARHVARERRRALRRDRHEFREPLAAAAASRIAVQPDAQNLEQIELVQRGLAELPERERFAIHAYFLDELEVHEVCAMMELSRSGFYALVQRALARLAERIRPQEIEERRT